MENIEINREIEIVIKEKARDIHYALIEENLVHDNPVVNNQIRQELITQLTVVVKNTLSKFQIF